MDTAVAIFSKKCDESLTEFAEAESAAAVRSALGPIQNICESALIGGPLANPYRNSSKLRMTA
jgi:hypothetical protein